MIRVTVTKLYKDRFVSVRDYQIKKAIIQGGMIISHKGNDMFLDPDKLKNLPEGSTEVQSKFKGKYKLVDIVFKADCDNFNQKELFAEN